jgi:hypothetical protein
MIGLDGIEKKELVSNWAEMDNIMKFLYPTHSRRISFLAMKPTKGQTPSNFIQKMKELTEPNLILHLTTTGLPQSDLNKDVKAIIIKELRVNPNQKDLKIVLEKVKGVEADGTRNSIRRVGDPEWKYRACNKPHAKGKCGYTCLIFKRKGHKEDKCWHKDKREREK